MKRSLLQTVHHAPVLRALSSAESFHPGETSQMVVPGGAAPPMTVIGLDVNRLWPVGSARRRSQLVSGSVRPVRRSRAPLRLPSLEAAAKGPGRGTGTDRLSQPSLFDPGQDVLSEGLPGSHRPNILQIRPLPPLSTSKPSPLPLCRNCSQNQTQNGPINFSGAIQPSARPRPAVRHSDNPVLSSEVLHGDPRHRGSPPSQEEAPSVVEKPGFLSCSPQPADTAGHPGRAQLHVYLPSEADGEEGDEESVDEGFMDEQDIRITSLKLQEVPQTITNQPWQNMRILDLQV
ncbi:uncharacterized protein LOC119790487 isoform X2 [Cyprinodon tularosa]|uniref:uncharacterized protein LOC119790487 isoform X2 n=1 Tax=Cyprinodon tularosa TaxID=77115 RepID=UPI0018E286DD|nr:uncharacterized protein LOC119790487 isoform X2 [Cyprinodon tularosa]